MTRGRQPSEMASAVEQPSVADQPEGVPPLLPRGRPVTLVRLRVVTRLRASAIGQASEPRIAALRAALPDRPATAGQSAGVNQRLIAAQEW
jgi:hypothetical protein